MTPDGGKYCFHCGAWLNAAATRRQSEPDGELSPLAGLGAMALGGLLCFLEDALELPLIAPVFTGVGAYVAWWGWRFGALIGLAFTVLGACVVWAGWAMWYE